MKDRDQIARRAAEGVRAFEKSSTQIPAMVGFDGFVDSIIAVVDKRHDAERFDPVETIEQFGRKVLSAAGQSSNYELVVKLEKLGGNGPIMANALATLGFAVTYIGSLGRPTLHPVFQELAGRAKCHSIANPGLTDALEFQDGKLMLGKHQSLKEICWQRIMEVIGLEPLRKMFGEARLIGMVNWTMLPCLSELWIELSRQVLEGLPAGENRRRIFVDLADPEKRTWADLRQALELCSGFERYAAVTLGMNLKEAVQVASALDIEVSDRPEEEVERIAVEVREALAVNTVVIHPRAMAAAATVRDGKPRDSKARDGKAPDSQVVSARFAGPFATQPLISTGAGDHFNAGFCLGQMANLDLPEALCVGTGVSGYYVRNAHSPTVSQLASFLDELPAPQGKTFRRPHA